MKSALNCGLGKDNKFGACLGIQHVANSQSRAQKKRIVHKKSRGKRVNLGCVGNHTGEKEASPNCICSRTIEWFFDKSSSSTRDAVAAREIANFSGLCSNFYIVFFSAFHL